VTLLVGHQEGHLVCEKTEWWGAGVVVSLGRGANLHMVQLMPLTVSCSSKSRFLFPFWYWLFQRVPNKGPLNGCCCYIPYGSYNTRHNKLYLSQVNFSFRGRLIKFKGSQLWNRLPKDLTDITSLGLFKKRLRYYLTYKPL